MVFCWSCDGVPLKWNKKTCRASSWSLRIKWVYSRLSIRSIPLMQHRYRWSENVRPREVPIKRACFQINQHCNCNSWIKCWKEQNTAARNLSRMFSSNSWTESEYLRFQSKTNFYYLLKKTRFLKLECERHRFAEPGLWQYQWTMV